MLTTALDRLAELAAPGGGWGYQPGQPAHLEPTALAVLALSADRTRYATVIDAGVAAIEANRAADGTYRLTRGRPQAVWPTALVLFAEQALGLGADRLATTADVLLRSESRAIDGADEKDMAFDIDLTLKGWGWAEANFAWVEPTAWACLALRAAGKGSHPRVAEGLKLLLDRAFDSGGANYGNRIVLGKSTEPIPGPTAVLVLALQGVPDEPRVDAARGYLRVHAAKSTDLEHLAWAKLALAADPTDSAAFLPELDQRIAGALSEEIHRTDGLGAGPYRLALAGLALNTAARHPFRLADKPTVGVGAGPRQQPQAPPTPPLMERLKGKVRNWVLGKLSNVRPLPESSAVHIARAADYDAPLADILATQYEHFRAAVPLAGKRVVLKPNLVEYRREKVINTDPRVVDAVITLCKKEGAAEVVVAEGPGHWRNVQFLVKESGLGAVLEKHGVRFVDINHDEPVKLPNMGRLTGLDHLYLSRTVASAEVLISLPKLKTHHWAGATLSLKNLFGTLPGICYGWPKNELHWRGIPNSIVDIACTCTPHLAIVDGIVGMEGDGPLMGTAKTVGALIMGADLVAVDATCCRLMHLPPERVPTLVLAALKRLGRLKEADIPQLGVPIAALATPFEWPPRIEEQLLTVEKAAAVKV
ncbi:DUF362 domain-containing protein [Urbifossiella limnaea]|uniref:DUF362 domain-containing protein n=1 Tax=Urbifossiella limnaea TaxID=2528023 RepID=A0A517XSM5_9BACT|nr:DUF362 domain-containing protein [Urbifossiella limnaea]QDU20507.1 hypothetical protein ETAA1_24590 [Urbifossiella limnaea]